MRMAWFGLALASLFVVAWLARYAIDDIDGGYYKLDRWTGEVGLYRCRGTGAAIYCGKISN